MIKLSKLKKALKGAEKIFKGEDFISNGYFAVLNGSADIEAAFAAAAEKKNLKISKVNYSLHRFTDFGAEEVTAAPRYNDGKIYFVQDEKISCINREFFEIFYGCEIRKSKSFFEFWEVADFAAPILCGIVAPIRPAQDLTPKAVERFPLLSEVEEAEKRERAEKRQEAKQRAELPTVFEFSGIGNRVVRRKKELTHIAGNFYFSENDINDINIYFVDEGVGFCFERFVRKSKIEQVKEFSTRPEYQSGAAFAEFCVEAVEKYYIYDTYIEYIRSFAPETAEIIKQKKIEGIRAREAAEQKKEAEKKAAEAAEETEAREKNRAEIQQAINDFVVGLKNGGRIVNKKVEIYKNRYERAEKTILNLVAEKYGVKIPLRVQGWINDKLVSVTAQNGKIAEYSSYSTSNTIWDYFKQILSAVNAA